MVFTTNLYNSWTFPDLKTSITSIGGGPAFFKEKQNIFPQEIYLVLNEDQTFSNAFYFDKDNRKNLETKANDIDFWLDLGKLSAEGAELFYKENIEKYVLKETVNSQIKIFIRCLSI